MKQKSKGFTLIELLVTITIVGILSGISTATFRGYIEKARLAKAQAESKQFERLFLTKNASTENTPPFLGWYRFDGDDVNVSGSPYVIDRSDASNNLTSIGGFSGSISADSDTGIGKGKSLRLNKKHLEKENDFGGTPVDKISIAFWFKVNNYGWNSQTFLIHSGTAAVGLENSSSEWRLVFTIDDNEDTLLSSTSIEKDTWYYVITSFADGEMKIWLDGNLIAQNSGITRDLSFSSDTSPYRMRLGHGIMMSEFDGWLDEVTVLPYAFDGTDLD